MHRAWRWHALHGGVRIARVGGLLGYRRRADALMAEGGVGSLRTSFCALGLPSLAGLKLFF